MFTDRVTIYLKAGKGGNGCVSFRREKYIPHGGPDGGKGGKGGDIIFQAEPNITTLTAFYYQPHIKADSGKQGRGANRAGRGGKNLLVKVPLGTLAIDPDTGIIIHDFTQPDEKIVVAKSGRGGRGNALLTSRTNRLPKEAEKGEPGEELTLRLELKLIADIGLVGFPNAGKSTLISHLSSAKPKIASYPFTTLTPVLGTVKYDVFKEFVIADIPGILEGAHENVGLGHEFLRHIERTKILVFVIDMGTPLEHPLHEYHVLEEELRLHKPDLITKPRIVVANKQDIPEFEQHFSDFINSGIHDKNLIFPVSAATGGGLKELKIGMIRMIEELREKS